MANSSYISMSAALAASQRMEVTANNIANVNTTGYKRLRPTFSQYLVQQSANQPVTKGYTQMDSTSVDVSQGAFEATGNPLDTAIVGPGFFMVQTPEGERLTRDGAFHVSNDGSLVNATGHPVLTGSAAGERSPIAIDADQGPIRVTPLGEIEQNGTVIATLSIVDADPQSLSPAGQSLFAFGGAPLSDVPGAEVLPEHLEGSNVSSIREMVAMIESSRNYQQAQKIMSKFRRLDQRMMQLA